MLIAIVLTIMNCVILPKQPALPSQLQLNHDIYTQFSFYLVFIYLVCIYCHNITTQKCKMISVHTLNLIPGSFSKDIQILLANHKFQLVCFGC